MHSQVTAKMRLSYARSCIAQSQRTEFTLGTRVDSAIQAVVFLEEEALGDTVVQEYLEERPVAIEALARYHARALAVAQTLLSKWEQS